MRVLIFGSTGSIGQHLVQQSLHQGHEVTAFGRNMNKLNHIQHSNLQKVAGDVFDALAVRQAVKEQDVVMITLGAGMRQKNKVRSKGTQHIIEAMQFHGVKRLICQSTLGAGESKENLNFFWKHIMFGFLLKSVLLEHEEQEKYVKNSGLDWTIVRPGSFTDGPLTSQYQHGFAPSNQSISLKISRADVANFLLQQATSQDYLFQSPGLSY